MKLSNLVLIILWLLCMALVVTAQLQPTISIDFSQYCIGDSWKFRLSNGVPNTLVHLLGNSNGQSWEIADWGRTDTAGNFTQEGTIAVGRQPLTATRCRWHVVEHRLFCGFPM